MKLDEFCTLSEAEFRKNDIPKGSRLSASSKKIEKDKASYLSELLDLFKCLFSNRGARLYSVVISNHSSLDFWSKKISTAV